MGLIRRNIKGNKVVDKIIIEEVPTTPLETIVEGESDTGEMLSVKQPQDEKSLEPIVNEQEEQEDKVVEDKVGEVLNLEEEGDSDTMGTCIGKIGEVNIYIDMLQVLCLDDMVVYEDIDKAHEITKISKSGIEKCCEGQQKTSGKKKWIYAKDYIKNEEK